jgi:hypothetical protein
MVTGEWRRLHKEELYALYSSRNIIRVIKKNEMGRACSTYGEEERCIQGYGGENLSEGGNLEHPGVDGRIILK